MDAPGRVHFVVVSGVPLVAVEGSTLTVETTNARGTQKRVYKK